MPATRRSFFASIRLISVGGNLPSPTCTTVPHDTAAHFIEKSVALDDKRDQHAGIFDVAACKLAHGGFLFHNSGLAANDLKLRRPTNSRAAARMAFKSSGRVTCHALWRSSGFIAVWFQTK